MVPALTAQAIFDQVVTGLAPQGGPALNDEGHCLYRANTSPTSA